MTSTHYYTCECETCGYEREFLKKSKTKKAFIYHQYKNPDHEIEWGREAHSLSKIHLERLQEWTYDREYEFEEEYRWWMRFR